MIGEKFFTFATLQAAQTEAVKLRSELAKRPVQQVGGGLFAPDATVEYTEPIELEDGTFALPVESHCRKPSGANVAYTVSRKPILSDTFHPEV